MDRQGMERCLEQVAAYKASGQKAGVWAEGNGVSIRMLASWCAHAQRWRARLDGLSVARAPTRRPSGFVGARVVPGAASGAASTSVRVELISGGTRVDLHWPLIHVHELASLLRELGR